MKGFLTVSSLSFTEQEFIAYYVQGAVFRYGQVAVEKSFCSHEDCILVGVPSQTYMNK